MGMPPARRWRPQVRRPEDMKSHSAWCRWRTFSSGRRRKHSGAQAMLRCAPVHRELDVWDVMIRVDGVPRHKGLGWAARQIHPPSTHAHQRWSHAEAAGAACFPVFWQPHRRAVVFGAARRSRLGNTCGFDLVWLRNLLIKQARQHLPCDLGDGSPARSWMGAARRSRLGKTCVV